VHKKKKTDPMPGASNPDSNPDSNSKASPQTVGEHRFEIPFFLTPNFMATSTSTMSSKKTTRSTTPKQSHSKSAEISKTERSAFCEMPGLSLEHSVDDEVGGDAQSETEDAPPLSERKGPRKDSTDGIRNGLRVDSLTLSPIQLFHGRSLRMTASGGPTAINPIFKTMSVTTNETESTRTTSAEEEDSDDAANAKQNVGDVDPLMFQHHISVQPEQDEVASTTIHELTENGPVSFDSLNFGTLSPLSSKKPAQSAKNGLTPLSRSASCIDVPAGIKSEDSVLSQSMASSMTGPSSMAQFRRERLSLKASDLGPGSAVAVNALPTSTDSATASMADPLCSKDLSSPSEGNLLRTPSTPSRSQDDLVANDHGFGIHPIMERLAADNHEVREWFFKYLDQLLEIQCHFISTRSKTDDGNDDIYDVDTVNGSFIWKNELRKHWVRSRVERKKLMAPKPPENPWGGIKFAGDAHKAAPSPMAGGGRGGGADAASSGRVSSQRSVSPFVYGMDGMAEMADGLGLMESDYAESQDDVDWFGMDQTVDHDASHDEESESVE